MKTKITILSMLLACCLTSYAQDQPQAGTPFNGPHTVPCVIQAEDFDEGGQDVAYHSMTPWGTGNEYRSGTDVRIENEGNNDGYHLASLGYDDWLNYTIDVAEAGSYTFEFTWANPNTNRYFNVSIDGVRIGSDYASPDTKSWTLFETVEAFTTNLTQGRHLVRVYPHTLNLPFVSGDFDKFEIKTPYTGTAYPETGAQTIPGAIEAEYFDNGGEGVAYYVSQPVEGSENVIRPEEKISIKNSDWVGDYVTAHDFDWLKYTVNVQENAKYNIYFRLASTTAGRLKMYVDNAVVCDISIEATVEAGQELEWAESTITSAVNLRAGTQILIVKFFTEGEGEVHFADIYIEKFTYAGYAYNGPHTVPCKVEAEDFDEGGEGIAYHDEDVGFSSGSNDDQHPYRPGMYDVELEYVADQDVIDVGWCRPGEWLNYTVDVPEAGRYAFDMRWGCPYNSEISVDIDFEKVGSWPIFYTPSMTTFDTHTYFEYEFTAGTHIITVFTNRGRFDWFEIKKAPTDQEKIISLNPALYYSFENEDFKTPTVGSLPLEFYKMGENNTIGTPYAEGDPLPTPILGPTPDKKALSFPKELFTKVTNPAPVADGSTVFTLLYDIRFTEFLNYFGLLQKTMDNSDDADFWVGRSGSLQKGGFETYALSTNTYYRLVLTSDESGNYKIYVDGIQRHTYDHPDKIKDFFWIFTDNDGECGELDCSGLAFWNRTLTAEEVAALGEIEKAPYIGTPYEGIIPNIPEDIIEAEFFNVGNYGITYYVADQTTGGENNSIRQDVGLPIRTDDEDNSYIILKNKEWTTYTINVTKTDSYVLLFSTKGTGLTGKLNVFVDDNILGGADVYSSDDWAYLELSGVSIEGGQHLLKIRYDGTGALSFADLFIDSSSNIDKSPTYAYDFEDPSDLAKPIIGNAVLEFYNTADLTTLDASGIQSVEGPKVNKKAIFVDPAAVIKVLNPLGPSFNDKRLDIYTMLWDVKLNALTKYNSFLQTNEENIGDGDLFVRNTASGDNIPIGAVGVGALGYSAVGMQVDTWHRLVFSSNGMVKRIFLDGQEIRNASSDDARFTLGDFFWIFADNDGERLPLDCSQFVFWANKVLSDVDLQRLGYGGDPTAIKNLETPTGKVYAENGKLHVEGYSTSASVVVYNLVGQKITAAKSLNGKTVSVPNKALYIVKVTDKGKSDSYKILSK
jgi:hypothetical protein